MADEAPVPGLRHDKAGRPMWRATKAAVKEGYPVKTVNLAAHTGAPARLRERCERLQQEMLDWLAGRRDPLKRSFDGTFDSLLAVYETDPKSPFFKLKEASKHPYLVYVGLMRAEIGGCRIDETDGTDVETWFEFWASHVTPRQKNPKIGHNNPPEPIEPIFDGKRHLAKARTAIAVLKAAIRFGIMRRFKGCAEFKAILSACRFETLKPREFVVDAGQVVAVRAAAHDLGHPRAALCYALQFEATGRQWDMRGQWLPMSDPAPSAILDRGKKWIGPTWANVDANMVLRFTPTKTQTTSGKTVVVDLRACPMVMEEIDRIPLDERTGPLIVNPRTGLPYSGTTFKDVWRDAREAAGIAPQVWNRDLRKSGSTEARAAGAATDDLQKLMGHVEGSKVTAKVYDQAALEAHRRVAQARAGHRGKKQ